jgi:AhpD family alkylhydroperoxidase
VDPVLVRFAADLSWLQKQGVAVERSNLSQNPAAFVENELVNHALTSKGEAALPIVLVKGNVVASGRYPERAELETWAGLALNRSSKYTPAVNELVAMGAAIAANCEPCLKYHYNEARKLGVSVGDMARAVGMAAKVKDSPHQAILRMADRLTSSTLASLEPQADVCCEETSGSKESGAPSSKCCG